MKLFKINDKVLITTKDFTLYHKKIGIITDMDDYIAVTFDNKYHNKMYFNSSEIVLYTKTTELLYGD